MGELIRVSDAWTHTGIRGISVAYAYVRPGLDQRASRRHLRVVQHTHLQIQRYLQLDFGIYNPLEEAVGGLASLMPTVDIVTQRSSAGIGNAWDFYDRQRTYYMSDVVTHVRGAHTLHLACEIRRTNLKGEYMARTNGDLDYDNWALFFTGHGASGGGSDLDQGDTRRDYNMVDLSFSAQDDWRIRRDSSESGRTMGLLRMA